MGNNSGPVPLGKFAFELVEVLERLGAGNVEIAN